MSNSPSELWPCLEVELVSCKLSQGLSGGAGGLQLEGSAAAHTTTLMGRLGLKGDCTPLADRMMPPDGCKAWSGCMQVPQQFLAAAYKALVPVLPEQAAMLLADAPFFLALGERPLQDGVCRPQKLQST